MDAWPSGQSFKTSKQAFSTKNPWASFSWLALHWALEGSQVHLCGPFKNYFPVRYSLEGLVDASPVTFKARCFPGIVWVWLLKSGNLAQRGSNLLLLGVVSSFHMVAAAGMGHTAGLCLSLSYPLQYKFILIRPACRNGSGSF